MNLWKCPHHFFQKTFSPIIPLALAANRSGNDSILLLAKDFVPLVKAQSIEQGSKKETWELQGSAFILSLSFATGYGTDIRAIEIL